MATRYFKNSADQYWDTIENWWSDAACTEGFSGTLTGVTVTDTDETVTCDSTAGLVVGRPITGTGIDTGSTVASITNGTDFELSLPAIANGSSNLTCELHVIPVTADDVVIATGNGTVAGTPSAAVLGLVTVNGDSGLEVMLTAANFEFNDTSFNNYGTITGNCTFNDDSLSNGDITGNCTFNDASNNNDGPITGNCTFYGTSFNNNIITGDCTFNDASYNFSTITGDCTFNDASNNLYGTITGNCTFYDTSNNLYGTVTGDFQWSSSDYNYGTITGDCVGGAVRNEYPGVIHGNCTVGTGGTVAFNGNIINGDCDFLSGGYQYSSTGEINGNVTFSGNRVNGQGGMTGGVINGDVTFSDNTIHDFGTINGAVTFNDTSRSQGTINNGPVTFNDSSIHDTSNHTITGDCTFNDYAYTYNFTAGITGNCTFNDNSYNYSTVITGNATVRQHAAAFVAWRDYATSTYVTGTLTLQFPEMDVLGTGLL